MRRFISVVAVAACLVGPAVAWAQTDFSKVKIQIVPVADGIHMLVGAGGNIGVFSGRDGVFLIDDQFAPLTEKIVAAVAEISDGPIRFVLNTHWHGDHTGGNENLGKAGVIIVAHDNVRKMMSADQVNEFFNRTVPASVKGALPVITFNDSITFHLNGQEIKAFHVAPAHTDGDSIVHSPNADVIHAGDVYFNGMYPFIDSASGGSLEGTIAAVDLIVEMIGDETKVMPGHGPLSNKTELKAYRDMLATVHQRMAAAIAAGKSADDVVADKLTADLDEKWGKGFFPPDRWLRLIYKIMKM